MHTRHLTEVPEESSSDGARTFRWQERLLPLMTATIIVCSLFFLVASLLQFNQLLRFAENPYLGPPIDDDRSLDPLIENAISDTSKTDLAKWRSLLRLERQATRYRYHEVAVFSVFRIWTRYTAFVTGMILVCVGSVFVLGKLRETESRMQSESMSLKISLATSSPGILFAAFGVVLMVTTLLTQFPIDNKDQSLYFLPVASAPATQLVIPPPADVLPKKEAKNDKRVPH